ncbi:MAG: hypothetical protein AAB459_01840 [Patescibacteria group bacterium]
MGTIIEAQSLTERTDSFNGGEVEGFFGSGERDDSTDTMSILEITETPHFIANSLTGVVADSNNGSSDGGSCGHCSSGGRFLIDHI